MYLSLTTLFPQACDIQPVTHLINRPIQIDISPLLGNRVRVIPVFKSGAPDEASNYRPVSILPVFSMVLEKIGSCQPTALHTIKQHFTPITIWLPITTFHRNSNFVEQIKQAIDGGDVAGAVSLDLKKV